MCTSTNAFFVQAKNSPKIHTPGRTLNTNNVESIKKEWDLAKNETIDFCRNTIQGKVYVTDENGMIFLADM